ncbi:MAG: hypothetical protein HYY06_32055 [Deltaproteobacteria bacterium]|nr:hypothetical protein [Deltaproteobacteria bacterium]
MRTLSITLLVASSMTAGCFTTRNVAAIGAPLRTRTPVSASDQYVARDGSIVSPAQYSPVRQFKFTRRVRTERHDEAVSRLELAAQLDREAARSGGDAITNMSLGGEYYDPGDHVTAAFWKLFGWGMIVAGAAILPIAIQMQSKPGYITAGSIAGIGGLSLLLANAFDAPSEWRLVFTGTIVRRNAAAK